MGKQQRKLPRMQFDSPVRITLLNERNAIISVVKGEGRLHDLSASGCAFFIGRRVDKGDRVELKMALNEQLAKKYQQSELTVRGDVVRVTKSEKGYMVSVKFWYDR